MVGVAHWLTKTSDEFGSPRYLKDLAQVMAQEVEGLGLPLSKRIEGLVVGYGLAISDAPPRWRWDHL